MKKWLKFHGAYSCYTAFSLPACTCGLIGSSLWPVDRRRLRPGLQMVLHNTQAPCQSGQLQHYSAFWRQPWRTVGWGSLPSEQSFKWCTLIFTLLGRRNGQMCNHISDCGCSQWFGQRVRDLEEAWLENWWQGNLKNGHVDRLLRMGIKGKEMCVSCECSLNGNFNREGF